MRRCALVGVVLLLSGCHARGGLELRPPPPDATWDHAPANRMIRSMLGWGRLPRRRSGAGNYCRVAFPGMVPDIPYRYDPDADVFLIPLPDGSVMKLRGDPDSTPAVAMPTGDDLEDQDAAWGLWLDQAAKDVRGLRPAGKPAP